VLVMSVLTTLLFYWRILPPVVRGMAWLLERTLGVGGAVGPFDRRQYLSRDGGSAAVHPALPRAADAQRIIPGDDRRHGGDRRHRVVLYATLLAPLIPDAAAHFVIASVLGAPAAILVSLIMVPETGDKRTGGALGRSRHAGVLDHGCDRQGHHRRS
jgi:CNT family concentrative nucleoside transporter